MAMPKPEPRALKLFEALVPMDADVKVKPMFGNFAAFAQGTMFMGIFGKDVFVRLPEVLRAKALEIAGAGLFEPMKGRAMREYVVLPPSLLADSMKAKVWVHEAKQYATALGAKGKAVKPKGSGRAKK